MWRASLALRSGIILSNRQMALSSRRRQTLANSNGETLHLRISRLHLVFLRARSRARQSLRRTVAAEVSILCVNLFCRRALGGSARRKSQGAPQTGRKVTMTATSRDLLPRLPPPPRDKFGPRRERATPRGRQAGRRCQWRSAQALTASTRVRWKSVEARLGAGGRGASLCVRVFDLAFGGGFAFGTKFEAAHARHRRSVLHNQTGARACLHGAVLWKRERRKRAILAA